MPINRPTRVSKERINPVVQPVPPSESVAPAVQAAVQAELEKPAIQPVLDPGEQGLVLKQSKFQEQPAKNGAALDIATFRVEVGNNDTLTIKPRRGEPASKSKHPLIVATLTDDSSKKRIQVIIVELAADTIADADMTTNVPVEETVVPEQPDQSVQVTESSAEQKEE